MTVTDFRKDPRIVSALISISKKTRAIIGLRLAEFGLMTGEDDILFALEDGKTRSVSDLSRTLSVRFPTLEKAVDVMVDKGLLDRLAGPLVTLSEKGLELLPKIRDLRGRIGGDLAAVFGADQLEKLASVLETLDRGLGSTLAPAS